MNFRVDRNLLQRWPLALAPKFVMALITLVCATQTSSATVSQCDPGCICIYWSSGGTGWQEVRCPGNSMWIDTSPINPGPSVPGGSWGGSGTPTNPSTAPGDPLTPQLLMAVNNANISASKLVHGDRIFNDVTGKWEWTPTNCTDLFQGSKFNEQGWSLMQNYIEFRSGVGVQDASGQVPCSNGAAAWTTCCQNTKYVFICGSFSAMSFADQQAVLIHEAMHVAGQTEVPGGSGTPSSSPSSQEITAAVKAGCAP